MNIHQLEHEFIDAVDGRELLAKVYYPLSKNPDYFFNRRTIISPSEVGCRLSHRNALDIFLKEDKNEWLMICEDDISFDDSLVDFLKLQTNLNYNNKMLIHLGGQEGLPNSKRVFRLKGYNVGEFHCYDIFLPTSRWLYRTCAYLVNRSGAFELLKLHNHNSFIADDWRYVISNTKINNLYYIDLVNHPLDLSDSSIEMERV